MSSTVHQYVTADNLLQSAISAFEEWRMSRSERGPIPEHAYEIDEAVFVPKAKCISEDDGYLVLYVYNKDENRTFRTTVLSFY